MDVPALTTYTGKTADPLVAYQLAVRLFTLRPEFLDLHKEVAKNLLHRIPNSSWLKSIIRSSANWNNKYKWKHQRQK